MSKPLYANEQKLLIIAGILSAILWLALIIGTKGLVLALFPLLLLAYLFVQSGFISYLKGTGALISETQFPDVQQRVRDCAAKVGLRKIPQVYILHGNGMFNAFATRFLRKDYIILLSDVLDALEDDPEAINFYIGHEMGHIDRKHLLLEPFLSLALVLPLLGAAYARAREYTCDQYGAACCAPKAAQQGIALLAVGAKRYKTINMRQYIEQTKETSGFWMSFHELIASYPWLVKRFARVTQGFRPENMPRRNPLAYLLAIFVPRLSLMSGIVIYLVIVVSMMTGGVMEGQKMIQNAERQAAENTQAQEEDAAEMSTADILRQTVDAVNAGGPQKLDTVTTLQGAQVGSDNRTLIYSYTISEEGSAIDMAALRNAVLANSGPYWCHQNETALYRARGMAVAYQYKDHLGNPLGSVMMDLSDPATCAAIPATAAP